MGPSLSPVASAVSYLSFGEVNSGQCLYRIIYSTHECSLWINCSFCRFIFYLKLSNKSFGQTNFSLQIAHKLLNSV